MAKVGLAKVGHSRHATTAKIDPSIKIEIFLCGISRGVTYECAVELDYSNVFRVQQLFRVSSVWALGLNAKHGKDHVWLRGIDAPLSWARKSFGGTLTFTCSNVF